MPPTAASSTSFSSSRLERTALANAELERATTTRALAHCERALDQSRLFSRLRLGTIEPAVMLAIWRQYGFFRQQLHRWFGLCIIKAASSSDPSQRAAIMALADHIFTDLRDGHDAMFDDFVRQLQADVPEPNATPMGPATAAYNASFFEDFGDERVGFEVALSALSGRELCVSLRNQKLLGTYFDARGRAHPVWLALHAELEIEHFLDAVRPVLMRHGEGSSELVITMQAIERGIDRQVHYLDELLNEAEQSLQAAVGRAVSGDEPSLSR